MFSNKITLLLLCFFGSIYAGYGQYQVTETIDLNVNKPTEWAVYFVGEGIQISYKLASCDPEMGYDQESVLLKIENTTNSVVVLNWHQLLSFNDNCKTCDYEEEYSSRLKLGPLQSEEGTCSIYSAKELKYFSKFIDANYTKGESLTSFKLDKLVITTITESND